MRRRSPRIVRPHLESLETRVMLASDALQVVQNPTLAADVDGDGRILPLDALVIANAVNSGTPSAFLDVNGDGLVTGEDADSVLMAFNSMNEGEGEPGEVEFEVARGTFVIYDSDDGSLRVRSRDPVTTFEITSASGIFTGDPGENLPGPFDIDRDDKIFKLAPGGFTEVSFGKVAVPGLSDEFVRSDLTINGSIVYPDPDNPGGYLQAGLSNKVARLRVQITKPFGGPTAEVSSGDELDLRILVEDRRGHGLHPEHLTGVFAAYMDVTWDSRLAEPIGEIQFSEEYTEVQQGSIEPGLIDEIGAVANSGTGLPKEVLELARVRFRAKGEGQLTFKLDSADIVPQHDVLLFGDSEAAAIRDIEFVDSFTVNITDSVEAPDLVQFAKNLAASGAVFYGASWCPHCTEQKEMFEDGQQYLPFVEVTHPDRTLNEIGIENKISPFPTWIFRDGSRLIGRQSLQQLSSRAGVPIPVSNEPSLAAIEPVTLLAGSPLHIPLDGYDPNGGPLTYLVSSDNPMVSASLPAHDSRSLRVDVVGFGEMTFQLFENRAPRVTERIITLAERGFYDGVTVHRVLDDFVIQAGDPTGTGAGGSDLGDFDDQYHVELQHNRTGVLSMAKAADDTNDSQFFVAEGPQRHLDFNHSIFGQLVEGEANREAISNTAVTGSRPDIDVVMDSVSVFEDIENGLLMLQAPEGLIGSANITVTVVDEEGHEAQQRFTVDVIPDTSNGGPFLEDIPELTTFEDTPFEFDLRGVDVEGDEFEYSAVSGRHLTLELDPATGRVTATPDPGFLGTATGHVGVRPKENADTADGFDAQTIQVNVIPRPPLGPRVVSSSLADGVDLLTRDVTVEIQFDLPLKHRGLDSNDVLLIGEESGLQRPTGFSYDLISRTLRIRFEELPLDDYTFVLKSTLDGIVGENGTPLDGENLGDQLPSGNGEAGGDYVIEFTTGTGDLDQNGTHDLLDVELLCALIRVGLDNPAFDYDGSGELDEDDMVLFLERVFSTGPGDSNLDGVFDSSDLVAVFVAGEYEDNVEANSGWAEGDWNCNGDFDSSDLVKSFAAGGYVRGAQPALREVAAAFASLYADQDSKPRSRTFVA